jgi:hypothetical protein
LNAVCGELLILGKSVIRHTQGSRYRCVSCHTPPTGGPIR